MFYQNSVHVMSFLNFFSRLKKDRSISEGHVKNLLEMALANGFFDEKENELLQEIAKERKINLKVLDQIKIDPSSIPWKIPEDESERFSQFYDLVKMMMADGNIDYEEVRLCQNFAVQFGYNKKYMNDIIHSVSENIKNGQDAVETMKRVKWMLN